MKPKYITVEPYAAPVRILRTKREKKAFGVPEDTVGYCMQIGNSFAVALPWRYDESTVWHEAHHLARWLNDHHGVSTDNESHEADAYLQEHIVREIKRIYRKL